MEISTLVAFDGRAVTFGTVRRRVGDAPTLRCQSYNPMIVYFIWLLKAGLGILYATL